MEDKDEIVETWRLYMWIIAGCVRAVALNLSGIRAPSPQLFWIFWHLQLRTTVVLHQLTSVILNQALVTPKQGGKLAGATALPGPILHSSSQKQVSGSAGTFPCSFWEKCWVVSGRAAYGSLTCFRVLRELYRGRTVHVCHSPSQSDCAARVWGICLAAGVGGEISHPPLCWEPLWEDQQDSNKSGRVKEQGKM